MNARDRTESKLDAIAAEWIARRDHGLSARDEAELAVWLRQPAHSEAFARCESMWGALPKLRKLPPQEVKTLTRPKRRRKALVACLSAASAAAALLVVLPKPEPLALTPDATTIRTYSAAGDAELRVRLPDGSLTILRRGSQIRFAQTMERRVTRILSGEAHFTVAKSSAAPFYVYAGDVAIRDIGTAFDVRVERDCVAVLVTEGSVAVRDRVLTVGHEAVFEASRVVSVRATFPGEIEKTLGWKSRRLSFDRTSLSDAVTELNRYNVRQLRIADREIGQVLLAGVVQSDDPDAFVRLLETGFRVSAETQGDEIILRKAR